MPEDIDVIRIVIEWFQKFDGTPIDESFAEDPAKLLEEEVIMQTLSLIGWPDVTFSSLLHELESLNPANSKAYLAGVKFEELLDNHNNSLLEKLSHVYWVCRVLIDAAFTGGKSSLALSLLFVMEDEDRIFINKIHGIESPVSEAALNAERIRLLNETLIKREVSVSKYRKQLALAQMESRNATEDFEKSKRDLMRVSDENKRLNEAIALLEAEHRGETTWWQLGVLQELVLSNKMRELQIT